MKIQKSALKIAFLAFAGAAAFLAGCELDAHTLSSEIGGRGGGTDLVGLAHAGGQFLNAASLSQKDEDTIGQSVGVALTNQYPLVANDNLQKYVNLVGLTVANVSSNPGGNWVFGVLETPTVNAFSGPNGYVFVTHGLLQHVHDEAELAGVLAHEITHVCNHDGLKQVKANEEKGALVSAMQAADNRTAQLSVLADNGIDVVTRQGYDKQQEFAADAGAVKILAASGYNPASFLAFLQRLQAEGGPSGGQLMSTHPAIGERIARVSSQLRTIPPGGATLADRFNYVMTH
jgi:beta-barrel assembly-enhancing protease